MSRADDDGPAIAVERREAAISASLALFWVVCLWNFWIRGIHALGLNAAVFLGGVLWLVARTRRSRGIAVPFRWAAVPFGLLAASFALHDNTYVKTINLFLFPIGLGTVSLLGLRRSRATFAFLASSVGLAIVGPWVRLPAVGGELVRLTRDLPAGRVLERNSLANRVAIGVALSLALIVCFVLPLLESADVVFAGRIAAVRALATAPLVDAFDLTLLWRALTGLALTVALVAFARRLSEPRPDDEPVERRAQDSIVAGIVLASVSAVYLLFLGVQVERFFLSSLPLEFEATERLVKSGFWQLILLTAFNLVLQISTYRRTNRAVQGVLAFFGLASTLLLVSAAHRMYLYVTIYGLSHEKFFASYAVVYCAFLFGLFLWSFVRGKDPDLIRIAAVAGLWVFALTTILPIESVMVRVNLRLARLEGSRINVDQMELFGADAYPLVVERGREISARDYYALDERTRRANIWIVRDADEATPWNRWCAGIEDRIEQQAWYERSLSSHRARAAGVRTGQARDRGRRWSRP